MAKKEQVWDVMKDPPQNSRGSVPVVSKSGGLKPVDLTNYRAGLEMWNRIGEGSSGMPPGVPANAVVTPLPAEPVSGKPPIGVVGRPNSEPALFNPLPTPVQTMPNKELPKTSGSINKRMLAIILTVTFLLAVITSILVWKRYH